MASGLIVAKKLPPQMLAYCELNIYNSYNVQNKILKKFV